LFDYAAGTSTETFTDRNFPHLLARVQDLDSGIVDNETATCQAAGVTSDWMDACVLDLAMTDGDVRYADVLSLAPPVTATFEVSPPSDSDGGPGSSVDGGNGTCVPTVPPTEICDGKDNDCNGLVDDVDKGNDGIYDCQHIALFGLPGLDPSANFVAWLQSNGSVVERIQTAAGTPLTAALLNGYNVIILDRLVRTYTADEAGLLRDWVSAGGGLMVMSGYTGNQSDLDNPNSLVADLGLTFTPGLESGPVTMFVPHPLTTGITSMTFSGGFRVVSQAPVDGETDTVVANLTSGPVGVAQDRALGRVFLWGDEWITFDSQWTTMPQVKTFWVNILGWLGHFR
jgi:hypothetical protein